MEAIIDIYYNDSVKKEEVYTKKLFEKTQNGPVPLSDGKLNEHTLSEANILRSTFVFRIFYGSETLELFLPI